MKTKNKKRVCLPCRLAHSACDGQDPCRRCVAADSVLQCLPAPWRKRGRPTTVEAGAETPRLAGHTDGSQVATRDGASQSMHASFAAATAPTSWSGVTGEASGGYVVDLTASSPPLSSFFDQLQHPPQQQHTEEQQHQQEQEQQQQQHRLPVRHPHSSFVSGNANKRHSIVGDAGGGDASKRLRTAVEPSDRGDGQRDKLELQLDGGYISPLLSLLIEQVRDVKRENASLRRDHNETLKQRMQALEEQNRRLVDEVEQLRALVIKYQHQCQHHHQQHHKHRGDVQRQRGDDHECSFFEPTVPTMLAMSTTVAGASSVAVRDNGGKVIGSDRPTWAEVLGMAKHRYIAMHALPFLNHYQSETASAPSPVRDLMKDIYAVFDMGAPADPQDLCLHPPIFTYASHGYCALTGYNMSELVGKPIQTISRTDRETLFVLLTNIFAKPTSPVGELWSTVQTWQHKTGKPLTLQLCHQIFYNRLSKPQWLVITAEAVMDGLRVTPDTDILHTPSEFHRFRARFPAFFDSLFTTTTTTTTTTTRTARLHHAPNLITGNGGEASSSISVAQLNAQPPLLSTSWDLEQWAVSGVTTPVSSGVSGGYEASIQEINDEDYSHGGTSSSEQLGHRYHEQRQEEEALPPAAQLDDIDDEYCETILHLLNSPRPFSPFLS